LKGESIFLLTVYCILYTSQNYASGILKYASGFNSSQSPSTGSGQTYSGHDPDRCPEKRGPNPRETAVRNPGCQSDSTERRAASAHFRGLVELIPNKGARVVEPSMRDIREMFYVMSILEGTCARECAQNIDEKGLARLENLHGKLEKTLSRAKPREIYGR